MAIVTEAMFTYTARAVPKACRDVREVGFHAMMPVRIAECAGDDAPVVMRTLVPDGRFGRDIAWQEHERTDCGIEITHRFPDAGPCTVATDYRRVPEGSLVQPARMMMREARTTRLLVVDDFRARLPEALCQPWVTNPFVTQDYPQGGWHTEGTAMRQVLGSDRVQRLAAFHRRMAGAAFIDGVLHLPVRGPGLAVDNGSVALEASIGTGDGNYPLTGYAAALRQARSQMDATERKYGWQRRRINVSGWWEILDPETVARAAADPLAEIVATCRSLVRENLSRVGHWQRGTADAWFEVRDTLDANRHAALPGLLARLVAEAGTDIGKIRGGIAARKVLQEAGPPPAAGAQAAA